MARDYTRTFGRLVNRPLLVTPDRAVEVLFAFARETGRVDIAVHHAGATYRPGGPSRQAFDEDEAGVRHRAARAHRDGKLYAITDGVAVIPIEGTLVHKLGALDPYSGMTGYDGIAVKVETAAADPDVRGIFLDIDSPGGEVAGCFDLCDRLRAIGEVKPIWAVADELACSAAYALASQAARLFVPRTADVGSIGVVCMHVSIEDWLKNEGIAVTLIHAGAHKVDGNPYQALPESVRDRLQADVETVRGLFAATVGRGARLDAAAALATEAEVYMGEAAVAAGLADAVAAPADALALFVDTLADPQAGATLLTALKERTVIMTTTPKATATPTSTATPKPKAEGDTPEEEKPDEGQEGENAAPEDADPNKETPEEEEKPEDEVEGDEDKDARAAERRRIGAIMNAPEAKGREGQARALALETALSVDEARKVLAASPKESGGLARHMASVPNAPVGADGGAARTGDAAVVDRIAANHARLTGRKGRG